MRTISIQLWSLREETKNDFIHVLKRLSRMGFKAVEPAGFGALGAAEFKKICDDLGLKILSSHSPWARMDGTLTEAMDTAHLLGLKYLACGFGTVEFESRDSIKYMADQVNEMAELLKKDGLALFQHNHAFEFERLDDVLKYDIYLPLVPEVKLELDTYWCANFGVENPVEMVKKYSDRLLLAHIKDGNFGAHSEPNVAFGEGKIDIPAVVNALPESVKTIVVEFDNCATNIFTAVEKSRNFLVEKALGE